MNLGKCLVTNLGVKLGHVAKMIIANGIYPCDRGRVEQGGVIKSEQVRLSFHFLGFVDCYTRMMSQGKCGTSLGDKLGQEDGQTGA